MAPVPHRARVKSTHGASRRRAAAASRPTTTTTTLTTSFSAYQLEDDDARRRRACEAAGVAGARRAHARGCCARCSTAAGRRSRKTFLVEDNECSLTEKRRAASASRIAWEMKAPSRGRDLVPGRVAEAPRRYDSSGVRPPHTDTRIHRSAPPFRSARRSRACVPCFFSQSYFSLSCILLSMALGSSAVGVAHVRRAAEVGGEQEDARRLLTDGGGAQAAANEASARHCASWLSGRARAPVRPLGGALRARR